jgi:ribosome-associated translation inhibitor RaiA
MNNTTDRDIIVHGCDIALGEVLPQEARRKLQELTSRFFGRITHARVRFKRDGKPQNPLYHCHIELHVGSIAPFRANGENPDIHKALTFALQRLSSRLHDEKEHIREDRGREASRRRPVGRKTVIVPVRPDEASRRYGVYLGGADEADEHPHQFVEAAE